MFALSQGSLCRCVFNIVCFNNKNILFPKPVNFWGVLGGGGGGGGSPGATVIYYPPFRMNNK